MSARGNRAEVRNPVLLLPAMAKLRALDPQQREAMAALLGDLAQDAQTRANDAWRKHKAPMAAYWKACGVYAGHIKRALRAVPSEAGARRAGYTVEVIADNGQGASLNLLVRRGLDYDDTFKAWCLDSDEFLLVNGWLWVVEEVP